MSTSPTTNEDSASRMIDARIAELGDWRGKLLARLRKLVHQADPGVVETWKWRGVPVWEHDGILCTGETYKAVVKMTFANGASLPDPAGLFNSSLDGNVRRAIDFHEADAVDEAALKALVRAAVALNTAGKAKKPAARANAAGKAAATASPAKSSARKTAAKKAAAQTDEPAAAGGRPTTIAAYIAAAPAAGQPLLRRLHAILKKAAPKAREAIKWNQPFFIEPRFVYSFSANKAHANLTIGKAREAFANELKDRAVTPAGLLQLRYDQPLPEDLVRRIAEYLVAEVAARTDDSFW